MAMDTNPISSDVIKENSNSNTSTGSANSAPVVKSEMMDIVKEPSSNAEGCWTSSVALKRCVSVPSLPPNKLAQRSTSTSTITTRSASAAAAAANSASNITTPNQESSAVIGVSNLVHTRNCISPRARSNSR